MTKHYLSYVQKDRRTHEYVRTRTRALVVSNTCTCLYIIYHNMITYWRYAVDGTTSSITTAVVHYQHCSSIPDIYARAKKSHQSYKDEFEEMLRFDITAEFVFLLKSNI